MLLKERYRRYILKYGVIVACIVLMINLPACRQALQSNWQILPSATTDRTTTTIISQNSRVQAVVVPIITSQSPNDASRLFNFRTALAQFITDLHDDPQTHAVRPWTNHDRNVVNASYHFPGLSSRLLQDAFGDKRIGLIGDSTLKYMMRWIQTLLMRNTRRDQDLLQTMTLAQANLNVNPLAMDSVGWDKKDKAFIRQDFVRAISPTTSTHVSIHNETVQQQQQQQSSRYEMFFDWVQEIGSDRKSIKLWGRIRQWQPHVLVVNAGLHWLHFQGGGRDSSLKQVQMWIHYEAWLEQVVQLAEEIGTKLLLFKTTNRICGDKYLGAYAKTFATIQQERQGTAKPTFFPRCVKQLLQLQDNATDINLVGRFSTENITRYCQEGTFDEVGVQNLNDRLFHFVQNMLDRKATTSNLTISIFNDHDVFTCSYTREADGRHYHPLNLLRIRLLANMVQELYGK